MPLSTDPAEAPRRKLIVFTRHPRPGEVKTRMIPLLGEEGAAALHRVMTEHTMGWARELAARSATSLEVCFAAGKKDSASAEGSIRQWLGRDLICRPQAPGDLGQRMACAFRRAFAEGAGRVAIVGTDCPGITASLAGEAFDALAGHDLVLGPALDGGYYLIGLRKFAGPLFAEIPWGTSGVLDTTLGAAREAGLSCRLLEPLPDVDRPEDIGVWRREAPSGPASPPKDAGLPGAGPQRISVIIPALDEAANIGGAIASVNGQAEIIVADGGSSDDTAAIALAHGAKVIHGPRGRARQMNAGAAAASGDALLFLHADTRLPARFHEHVCRALDDARTAAGAFRLRLNSRTLGIKLVESMANLRSRCLGMPYGDQAIFLRAETFRDAGGFPDIPAMEDFELMRRLRRRGRITIVPADVVSSARRWLEQGVIVTTLINKAALFGYRLGVPARHIARWRGSGGE
jgi:rSAM/selenodomain-associated transferase 2/rSAM/selenodomain-associated transferase 1